MLIVIFMFPPLAIGALRFTHVRPVKFHDIKREKKPVYYFFCIFIIMIKFSKKIFYFDHFKFDFLGNKSTMYITILKPVYQLFTNR